MTDTQPTLDIRDLIKAGTAPKPVLLMDQEQVREAGLMDTPITVTSVQVGTADEHGYKWAINAIIDDQPYAFTLRFNLARDGFMEALAKLTMNGPVTGLKLSCQDAGGFKRVVIVPME